jgi:hypothetical protein
MKSSSTSATKVIRVLIADDHPVVREGLVTILKSEKVVLVLLVVVLRPGESESLGSQVSAARGRQVGKSYGKITSEFDVKGAYEPTRPAPGTKKSHFARSSTHIAGWQAL